MNDAAQLSYQPHLEELIAFASAEDRRERLLVAKAEFTRLTGEVYEDDKQFEMRMASFIDYYLFDRKDPVSGVTPAEEYLAKRSADPAATTELIDALKGFTGTIHGLFEVRKLGRGVVKLRELFSAKDFDVTERRQLAGLEKGDVLEARLIPLNGHLVFSAAFCCHPKAAIKGILKEVKRRKKKEPAREPIELTWECSRMALKVDRYRQVPVERIYDFSSPQRLPLGPTKT